MKFITLRPSLWSGAMPKASLHCNELPHAEGQSLCATMLRIINKTPIPDKERILWRYNFLVHVQCAVAGALHVPIKMSPEVPCIAEMPEFMALKVRILDARQTNVSGGLHDLMVLSAGITRLVSEYWKENCEKELAFEFVAYDQGLRRITVEITTAAFEIARYMYKHFGERGPFVHVAKTLNIIDDIVCDRKEHAIPPIIAWAELVRTFDDHRTRSDLHARLVMKLAEIFVFPHLG